MLSDIYIFDQNFEITNFIKIFKYVTNFLKNSIFRAEIFGTLSVP